MSSIRLPPLNPVLARELRQRLRGRQAWVVITLYLGILSLVLYLVYTAAERASRSRFGGNALANATIGRIIFQTLLFFMLILVCFIVPGLSSGAIAGERERQTLVSLQVSLLRPRGIVVGKVLASLAFVVLLLISTLPLVGVSFIVGGVSGSEVLRGTAMVLATAVTLAALSTLCSSLTRRTQGATVIAYGLTLFLLVGTFLVFGAQLVITRTDVSDASRAVLIMNPLLATADAVPGRGDFGDDTTPFTPLQTLTRRRNTVEAIAPNVQVGDSRPVIFNRRQQPRHVPFWLKSLVFDAVAVAGAVVLASRRIALPKAGGA